MPQDRSTRAPELFRKAAQLAEANGVWFADIDGWAAFMIDVPGATMVYIPGIEKSQEYAQGRYRRAPQTQCLKCIAIKQAIEAVPDGAPNRLIELED